MGIDWFTFGAQIVNFLILVALLKKFLYGPIIRAMDERERTIAASQEEADQKVQQAEREAETYRNERQQFEEQREELLAEARRTAHERHDELLREARAAVEHSKQEWYRGLKRQQESLLRQIRAETASKAVEIARRALRELADRELQEEIVTKFLEQFERMDPRTRQSLAEATSKSDGPVVVRTAFNVPEEFQQQIREKLRQKLGNETEIGFKTADELICGVELKAGGRKLGWSFHDFLDSLEFDFERAVAERAIETAK